MSTIDISEATVHQLTAAIKAAPRSKKAPMLSNLRCPKCDNRFLHKIPSGLKHMDNRTWTKRRYRCLKDGCDYRFNTSESILLNNDRILVASPGSNDRIPFDLNKLKISITHACQDTGISVDRIHRIATYIADRVDKGTTISIVTTTQLSDLVMESLLHLNHVAYIRYASRVLKFSSIQDYTNIINQIKDT